MRDDGGAGGGDSRWNRGGDADLKVIGADSDCAVIGGSDQHAMQDWMSLAIADSASGCPQCMGEFNLRNGEFHRAASVSALMMSS